MANDMPKMQVYRLGQGYATTLEGKPLYSWPFTVDYAPDNPGGDFYLAEGDARNGNGGFFRAIEVLKPHWRDHLERAGVLWLIPLLERMARGEDVPSSDVLDVYRQEHGRLPTSEEWPIR